MLLVDKAQREEYLEKHAERCQNYLPGWSTVEGDAIDGEIRSNLENRARTLWIWNHLEQTEVHQIDKNAEMDQIAPLAYGKVDHDGRDDESH